MSPGVWGRSRLWAGFPRVSGDEPASFDLSFSRLGFSPRERG